MVTLTGIMLFFTNCGSDGGGGGAVSQSSSINNAAALETLRIQKNQVFTNHCVGCHNSTATDTILKDILNTGYLDNNNFINLGSPQSSPLYLAIIDSYMPPGGGSINSDEIAIIRDWIAAEGGNFNTYIGGSPIDPGGGTSNTPFTPVRTVLRQYCTSCHRTGGVAPNLDVDGPTLKATMFNGTALVLPGNANGSRLFQAFGSMPQGGALGTNSTQAAAIRTWIANGAQ